MSILRKRITSVEAKHKSIIEEYLTNCHSPFTEDIPTEPLLKKLKMPQLIGYNGKGDLLSHYISWMEL